MSALSLILGENASDAQCAADFKAAVLAATARPAVAAAAPAAGPDAADHAAAGAAFQIVDQAPVAPHGKSDPLLFNMLACSVLLCWLGPVQSILTSVFRCVLWRRPVLVEVVLVWVHIVSAGTNELHRCGNGFWYAEFCYRLDATVLVSTSLGVQLIWRRGIYCDLILARRALRREFLT